jgi:hypothetical protein
MILFSEICLKSSHNVTGRLNRQSFSEKKYTASINKDIGSIYGKAHDPDYESYRFGKRSS